MKNLLLVLMIAVSCLAATAQTKFNGTVTFAVDYKGDMVDMLRSMMPNKQVYHYLEGNFRMETSGGLANGQGDVLYLLKEDKTYLINSSGKKAQVMQGSKAAQNKDTDISVSELDEKISLLGYVCDKYKVVVKTKEGEITQYIWATKEIEPVKPKSSDNVSGLSAITNKIKGMPLKIEMEFEQGGMSFTMISTATAIDETRPNKNLFVIPSDYTIEDFDAKKSLTR